MTEAAPNLLEVRGVSKTFTLSAGLFRRDTGVVRALDDISFSVPAGSTVGLVGESGCGKSTMGHVIMGGLKADAGEIVFTDPEQGPVNLVGAGKQTLRHVRLNMQMIFQDPNASLNPRMRLFDLIAEPLVINKVLSGKALEERVVQLLEQVGLSPRYMFRHPHALSGGQRQRVVIARALALNPQLVVADEPISALDVSIQAQVINLLEDLQEKFGLAYLLIAHDLSVVSHICDRIAVMYLGRIVEIGTRDEIFERPQHPYTQALLSAVPIDDPDLRGKSKRIVLQGDPPSPANPPSGCTFRTRCWKATDLCAQVIPPLEPKPQANQAIACHFPASLPAHA